MCLPPCGGSGLKYEKNTSNLKYNLSPSVWREWIEIRISCNSRCTSQSSPSVWREWIEMQCLSESRQDACRSPSVWREWIEIRKQKAIRIVQSRLPPCGGSGLKFLTDQVGIKFPESPSVWREWIEMVAVDSDA